MFFFGTLCLCVSALVCLTRWHSHARVCVSLSAVFFRNSVRLCVCVSASWVGSPSRAPPKLNFLVQEQVKKQIKADLSIHEKGTEIPKLTWSTSLGGHKSHLQKDACEAVSWQFARRKTKRNLLGLDEVPPFDYLQKTNATAMS